MRFKRALAFVVLATFVTSFALPWLGAGHQFNDDPHWVVAVGSDGAAEARVDVAHSADDGHCLVCHLQRTLRTASRPSQAGVSRVLRALASPISADPLTRAGISRFLGARGPPTFFL